MQSKQHRLFTSNACPANPDRNKREASRSLASHKTFDTSNFRFFRTKKSKLVAYIKQCAPLIEKKKVYRNPRNTASRDRLELRKGPSTSSRAHTVHIYCKDIRNRLLPTRTNIHNTSIDIHTNYNEQNCLYTFVDRSVQLLATFLLFLLLRCLFEHRLLLLLLLRNRWWRELFAPRRRPTALFRITSHRYHLRHLFNASIIIEPIVFKKRHVT